MTRIVWSRFIDVHYVLATKKHHMWRTKIGLYHLSLWLGIAVAVVTSLAIAGYVRQRQRLHELDNAALEYTSDYLNIAYFTLSVCAVQLVFFITALFVDVQMPERQQSPWFRHAWKTIIFLICCPLVVSTVAGMTIVVCTHSATVTGVDDDQATNLLIQAGGPNTIYHRDPLVIAGLVLLYVNFASVIINTTVMWQSLDHNKTQKDSFLTRHGPVMYYGDVEMDVMRPGNANVAATRQNENEAVFPNTGAPLESMDVLESGSRRERTIDQVDGVSELPNAVINAAATQDAVETSSETLVEVQEPLPTRSETMPTVDGTYEAVQAHATTSPSVPEPHDAAQTRPETTVTLAEPQDVNQSRSETPSDRFWLPNRPEAAHAHLSRPYFPRNSRPLLRPDLNPDPLYNEGIRQARLTGEERCIEEMGRRSGSFAERTMEEKRCSYALEQRFQDARS